MPGPESDARPAAALRSEPHHPPATGHSQWPTGALQGRLDQRRARTQLLDCQLRPPTGDYHQRHVEEHRAPSGGQLSSGADVSGGVHHAGR